MQNSIISLVERMSAGQLFMAVFSIAAVILLIVVLTGMLSRSLGVIARKKPKSYIKERNRFKAEIADEQGKDNFWDGIASIVLLLAIVTVFVAKTHGR